MNEEKYGLTEEQVEAIRLPAATYLVEIYDIEKITHAKSKLSCVEKINHLIKLQKALENKLEMFRTRKIPQTNSSQSRFGNQGGFNIPSRPAVMKEREESDIEEPVEEDKEPEAPPRSLPVMRVSSKFGGASVTFKRNHPLMMGGSALSTSASTNNSVTVNTITDTSASSLTLTSPSITQENLTPLDEDEEEDEECLRMAASRQKKRRIVQE